MRKTTFKNRLFLIVTMAVNLLLFVAVLFLMSYTQKLLNNDIRINLTEIVTQNKDVIDSKFKVEMNTLRMISNQFAETLSNKQNLSDDDFQDAIIEYSEKHSNQKVFITTLGGNAYFGDGKTLDISARKYFKLAVQGIENISEKFTSRLDGEDVFVISVGLKIGNEIMGTFHRFCTPEEMYELCSVSLFSSKGYIYIVNSQGYVVFSSDNAYNIGNNYIRGLYLEGNRTESEKFSDDMRNGVSGVMETTIMGENIFSAYTPIMEIHDWYLVSSVSSDAVSPNSKTVVLLFYFVLIALVSIFAVSMFYFFHYKNKQHSNLERIAFVDTITKGNTLNKFSVMLKETLQSQPERDYHVLVFDIDNFKYVNSCYGFDVGDRILKNIYAEFEQKLQCGEFLARVSGDHFVALILDAAPERLDALLNTDIREMDMRIYISAGLYKISDHNESINLMIDKAGTAAQSMKSSMHKYVAVYSAKYDEEIARNEDLKRDIETALKHGEIIPYYQPKVDINTGELVGAEALARWKKSDGSMVAPDRFIPLCEKTGQVVDIDMSIFRQTLGFLKSNLDRGIACVPISVNFSRLHLLMPQFIHNLTEELKSYGVPPQLIQIELTESIVMDNNDTVLQFVEHMHKHGLVISIDDFGSGYSSLNMLKDIPVDVLKLDRAFLQISKNTDRQKAIFASIVKMAKSLNIDMVVEGVETEDNVALMQEVDCSVAQGYYFSKPMSMEMFERIFMEKRI